MIAPIKDLSDTQIDRVIRDRLLLGAEKATTYEELRVVLHETLDFCVNGALASGLVITHLDYIWKNIGGKPDDPAPWQSALGGNL